MHICGRRYADRAEDVTEIKVYSNCGSVTLYVDGREFETKSADKVFIFNVPVTGGHTVKAVSGDLSDEIRIRRVEKANPDYCFGGAGNVVNWFDKIEVDPAYYSIKDKFGVLMSNPGTAAVVGRIMAKASASRGEVAQSTSGNKVLQQMMAAMSFESLLKKAGANVISPEQIRAINDMLQKVKKD